MSILKKIIYLKNHKDGTRYRIKNQVIDCLPWKAKQQIDLKVARLLYKDDIETTMKDEKKETR